MPKKSKKFKEIPLPEELKRQIGELSLALSSGSDLSCALVGGAFLDHCLGAMLQRYLVDGETTKSLLQPSGPLGTFSARRQLAYSLGLIQKSIGKELETIGGIRNAFAHGFFDVQFSDQVIKSLCNQLPLRDPQTSAPRERYTLSVLVTSTTLLLLALELEHRERKDEKSYPVFGYLTQQLRGGGDGG